MTENQKRRIESRTQYFGNPSMCRYCNKPIPLPESVKVTLVRRKKFCDSSCAAKFNNPRGRKMIYGLFSNCCVCDKKIDRSRRDDGKLRKSREYCDPCLRILRASAKSKNKNGIHLVGNRTKKQLRETVAKWQTFRNQIRANARNTFLASGKPLECAICKYDLHADVAHIKSVSDFSENTLISEINDINNLVALCPNHHWEYDHGVISKDSLCSYSKTA